ncbi:MAG: hypothetical protein JOY85_11670 [Acidobacteriaceae bacterium]|nr:hypothetical protein [Acidobacteriaceae bacterium]
MSVLSNSISLIDIANTLAGIVSAAPLFLVPGYLVNRTAQVFAGQEENEVDTIGASLALSIGVCPIVLYLLGKLSMTGTRVFFWLCALGLLVIAWGKRAALRRALSRYWVRFCIGLALLWLVIAIFSQIDWQWGNRVYPSGITFDDALRVGLVGGIARAHSLPPPDPFLRLGTAIPLGYHYFWFLLCSLVCREAPVWVGPRGALMAGAAWTALTLWAALSLWLRRTQTERQGPGVRWAVAALVLSISGLDLIVVIAIVIHRLITANPLWVPAPSLDWWSLDQITNWIDILLWVPHCGGALAACATGLLILTNTAKQEPKRRVVHTVLAGACFASAAGMSIYVAFGFAVFFAAYLILLFVRKNWSQAGQIVAAGVVAGLLAAPFLWETRANASGQEFFFIGFRRVGGVIRALTSHAPRLIRLASYPPEVALTVFLEFGFFLLALFYWWRMRSPRISNQHRWMLALLFLVPLLITSILRSDMPGTNNDLAFRAILPAQFALAVMAGEWLLNGVSALGIRPTFGAMLKKLPAPALLLLIAGLFTTAAEILLLRTFTMFQEANRADSVFIQSRDVGLLAADTRAAYSWLQQHSGPNTVVQNNPSVDWDFLFGLYANRQAVVNGKSQLSYKRMYSPRIRKAIQDLSVLFDGKTAAPPDLNGICSKWGIDYLLVKAQDPVWAKRNSWIWRDPPVYQNQMTRIYACSERATLSTGLVKLGSSAGSTLSQ